MGKILTLELLKKHLDEEDVPVVIMENPDYASAFIGFATDSEDRKIAVYEYNAMVDHLVADGMDELDAVEFIDYNTMRALPYYEGAPIIIEKPNWRDEYE